MNTLMTISTYTLLYAAMLPVRVPKPPVPAVAKA